MKKIIFIVFAILITLVAKAELPFQYEIECAGNATQGNYLVKVFVYHKKGKVTDEMLRRAAVHGVIFRGFTGGPQGCISQKPLVKNPSLEYDRNDYFSIFFKENGQANQYATVQNGTYERYKIKKNYKVGAIVVVNKDQLRTVLEDAGLIKKLSSIF